jgi:hypothetical protein
MGSRFQALGRTVFFCKRFEIGPFLALIERILKKIIYFPIVSISSLQILFMYESNFYSLKSLCGLFIFDFMYMQLKLWHFRGTYPLICQCYLSRYIQIHYMQTIFLGPYLSHITRFACTGKACRQVWNDITYVPVNCCEGCRNIPLPLVDA